MYFRTKGAWCVSPKSSVCHNLHRLLVIFLEQENQAPNWFIATLPILVQTTMPNWRSTLTLYRECLLIRQPVWHTDAATNTKTPRGIHSMYVHLEYLFMIYREVYTEINLKSEVIHTRIYRVAMQSTSRRLPQNHFITGRSTTLTTNITLSKTVNRDWILLKK